MSTANQTNGLSEYKYGYYYNGSQKNKTGNEGTTTYIYSGRGQLIETDISNGTVQKYTFDNNGNRLTIKEILLNNTAVITAYTYDANDRLITETKEKLTTTYTYDANGNQLTKISSASQISQTQEFDALNRMTCYNDGATNVSYTYYPNNVRKSKKVGNEITTHVWVDNKIALDMSTNNMINYIHGAKLIVSDYGWYHYNAHGDVVQLSDENGDVIWDYDYDPYGNIIESTSGMDENPYRYAGEYYDTESGYTYLRARYYDSSIGRFISEDPALDGLNWYVYCNNDPENMIDPSGERSIKIHLVRLWPYQVTTKQLKKLGFTKKARSSKSVKILNKYLKKYQMNKKEIVRHFISQCMKESSFDEQGAKGVLASEACWLTKQQAKNYCAQYDFRKDLGNNSRGDGYKYRGVGYIQVTGKYNQSKFGESIGDDNIVKKGTDYILQKDLLWAASTYWWHMNKMNALVNKKGTTVADVTEKVNGGFNGLKEREEYYKKCKKVFK